MQSISSKYRKLKGRLSKRRAACIRNLEKGKFSACNLSLDNKCDEILTEAVPSTSGMSTIDDGTWRKIGHASLYGIGIVIDVLTNLVVDFEVLSKYCHECSMVAKDLGEGSPEFLIWKSGAIRYTTILCDCDTKTHQHLNEKQVYGDDVAIEKEDCVNHVAKRLGTAFRN
ncbi:uncharacterized protein TNCV_845841 [Trichonephila clavipes]|nr:uncharacterized protein TNCV_845841 [Trichonephila clavipes]